LESLNILELFDMRNISSSLMALFSMYHCCYAYDLEFGSHVISLAYESLCSISYATYMFRLVDLSYGGGLLSVLVTDALVEDS
jgi:hypothetical protein